MVLLIKLNRQPRKILYKAYERPITITRNDQFFALLRREDVAYLVKGVTQSKAVFEVLSVAFRLLLGQKIGYEHPYGWLNVFDADELQDFIKEVSEAFRLTDTSNQAWDLIDAIIYEWKESAIAISSPELVAVFQDEAKKQNLC